jgi:biotin carboxylase
VVSGKVLLIISGDDAAADVARRARALGHTIVVTDSNAEAPAFAMADSCLLADPWGAQETAAAAERYSRKIRRIDGVLCCNEAALTAASVTQRLRLRGIPMHAAELVSDRLAVKRAFQSAGIAVPWFAEISTPHELQRAAIARGRELVVKPVEQRGTAGLSRLDDVEDLGAAFLAARAASATERVMVEEARDEILAAGLIAGGVCRADDAAMAGLLGRAALALGLDDCPVAALVTDAGTITELSPGVALTGELLDAAIAQALGE